MTRARWRALVPVLRTLGFAGSIALVVVIGIRAVDDVPLSRLDWWLVGASFAVAVVWWVLLACLWSLVVSGSRTRVHLGTWLRTQPLRYLPGGIWAPVSRFALVEGSAFDRLWTVMAENVVALCCALAVGGVALAAADTPVWAPLALVALVPLVLAQARPQRVAPRWAAAATANTLAAFAAYALCGVLVQAAISGWHDALAVAGAASVAWAAGLAVVIAPSGLGVREAVYVGLLSGRVAHGDLAAAALTMRVVTIAAELLVLVAVGRPSALRSRNSTRAESKSSA